MKLIKIKVFLSFQITIEPRRWLAAATSVWRQGEGHEIRSNFEFFGILLKMDIQDILKASGKFINKSYKWPTPRRDILEDIDPDFGTYFGYILSL